MANVANINVTITASDNTGAGISSAMSNLSRLGGSFGSIGSIAAGVFGGILGVGTFNGITRGIGSVISSAFGLNNQMAGSRAAAQSMVNAIAESEPVGTGAFGALSKAAETYARTLREIQEREQDGLSDYAEKVDTIKTKILETNQELDRKLADIATNQKQRLDDLAEAHLQTIQDINTRIEDENYDFNERLYDMANSRQDKLDNLSDSHENTVTNLNKKLVDAEEELLTATTAFDQARAQAKLDSLNAQLAEENATYAAEQQKINDRADHEVQVETDKHNRQLTALQLRIERENAEYDKRKKRIEDDANHDISEAKRVATERKATLNDQLAQEKQMHERFLRDIQEAYADAGKKMEEAVSGGGSGGGGRRTIQFQFDFGEAFRKMSSSGIKEYLDEVQKKYVEMGVKTPFNIGDIQNAGKAMIAYTGGSADNMNKILEATVSLAARNPMQGMLGATTAMVELFGSGNITSLARRFDIPKASLTELSKAKNETEFINLLTEALTRNGITMGLVDAKAQTLGGAFQNIMETFNLVSAAVAKPLWDVLTEQLVNVNKWLFLNQDAILNFATALGQMLTPSLTSISEIFQSTVLPGLQQIYTKMAELWEVVLPLLKKSFEDMGKWWKDHHVQIEAIAKATWAVIQFIIKTGLDFITGFIKTYTAIMKGDWSGAWEAIKNTTKNIFDNIVQLGKSLWASLKEHFKAGVNSIIDSINGFLNGLKQMTSIKINGKVIVSAIEVPQLPHLAAGGIVTGPTVAMIGEAGPEAIVPLSKGKGGIGSNIYISITGNNIMDDQTAGLLADKVGDALVNKIALQGRYL